MRKAKRVIWGGLVCVTVLGLSIAAWSAGQTSDRPTPMSASISRSTTRGLSTQISVGGQDLVAVSAEHSARHVTLTDATVDATELPEGLQDHPSGNPLDVACQMNRFTAAGIWYSQGFGAGDRAKVWYDPSNGAPIGCGANPYPYRIDSVWTTFQISAADTLIFAVDIECPVTPGDSCSGPGTAIWADTFLVAFTGAPGGRAVRVPVSACVNGPFFVGVELLYWGNATFWPSFRWGNDGDSTTCTQWLCDPTGCVEWRTIFAQANRGKMQWYVKGNTNDACAPTICTAPEACNVVCPGGSIPEGEPDCQDQYVDNFNGGCNSDPPAFQDISCGQTICGTSGNFIFTDTTQHQQRDTDWYRLTVATQTQITWTGVAEFPLQLLIIQPVNENCDNYSIIASATADSCDTARAIISCVNPGVYWLWAGPSVFTGIPCGRQYVAMVTCTTCPSGRCCYGADPANPQCANNNFADCGILAGTWTEAQTCAGDPCPSHLACQSAPVMQTQPPHNADESWTGVTSEANLGYLAYDNFANLPRPIASVRFWGLDAYFSGAWAACDEDPMPFVIKIYPDSSNFPASTPTCTYNLSLSRTATTVTYSTFPVWQYDATLNPPCSQASGWISVQGLGDTTCWFLWASSPYGDVRSLQSLGTTWSENAFDQAMCLASSPCDTSLRADSVTVSLVPGGGQTRLRFKAPQAGTYLIFSTVDKNAIYPNNYSLEATGTISVPAGFQIWIDPAAILPYKRYVVLHQCP
jgi:hypothetical protein